MASVLLDHVTKQFGDFVAVDDLHLDIEDKEFVTLVGPSGCGKTTTLRMIAGLEKVTKGTILFDDEVVSHLPANHRDIAMVFQSYALYPHMNVYENIGFALRMMRFPKDEIDRRIKWAAEMLGIGVLLDDLSGDGSDIAADHLHHEVKGGHQNSSQRSDRRVDQVDHDQCADQGQQMREQSEQGAGHEAADDICVGGEQGQNPAALVFMEITEGQRLQVIVEPHAQAGQHLLPGVADQIAVAETKQRLCGQHTEPDRQQGVQRHAEGLDILKKPLGEMPGQPGCDQGEGTLADHQYQGRQQNTTVRRYVLNQR